MFWRKSKPPEDGSSLLNLASRLGVERRQMVRVRYPILSKVSELPQIAFKNEIFNILDISVGGCCLFDPRELLGPDIGNDVELTLVWNGKIEAIKARIVSRVDDRRHIQFMNFNAGHVCKLKDAMTFGVRGQSLRPSVPATQTEILIEADEIWTSLHGDSVIFENHVLRLAQIHIAGHQYHIFQQAWPTFANGKPVKALELERLVLFMTNVAQPSPRLKNLNELLQQMMGGEQA
jgi:hypothetical protein